MHNCFKLFFFLINFIPLACALEYSDSALLDLAKSDPDCLSSSMTIPLLQEHEQKDLLVAMAQAAIPSPKRKTMDKTVQEKLMQLHTRTLLSIEPDPELMRSCAVPEIANSVKKRVHATSDGKLLINSYSGVYDITGQNAHPLMDESQMREGRWILGGAGTIVYQLHGDSSYADAIHAWDLRARQKMYQLKLPPCFWGYWYSTYDSRRSARVSSAEEKNEALRALDRTLEAPNYLNLLGSDLRKLCASYLSMHQTTYFRAFAVDKADTFFAVHNLNGITKIADAKTGCIIRSLAGSAEYSYEQAGIFSPDNTKFVSKLSQTDEQEKKQPYLLVWDILDEKKNPHQVQGDVAAFSDDSSLLATADSDSKQLKVWNCITWACLATSSAHSTPSLLQFSSDNKRILVKSKARAGHKTDAQQIWDLDSQTPVYTHSQDRLQVISTDQKMVVSNPKKWKNGQFGRRPIKLKHLESGQKFLLGTDDANYFAFDQAGNYLLVAESSFPSLYNARTGVLIQELKGKNNFWYSNNIKLNSFLANNRLITLSEKEACVWQLNPVDWTKISAQEKMAFLILEHNYRHGKTFSQAAAASINSLRELAQKRYPVNMSLADIRGHAIPFEFNEVNLKIDQKEGTERIAVHPIKYTGSMVYAQRIVKGHKTGQIDYSIHPTSVSNPDNRINLAQDKARVAYYLLHRFFNEHPKKDY